MSNPFVGEIRYVGFNFAPVDWAFCNGQILAISQFETLFNLIGTTYGGDGQTTFALPDLQGRVAIHQGEFFVIGEISGTEVVTLLTNEIPSHSHTIGAAAANGNSPAPGGAVFAESSAGQFAPVASATGAMGSMVSPIGGNQPHTNLQPYLTLNPIISLFGIFPSQG
jgi:microcystin-dependent protein